MDLSSPISSIIPSAHGAVLAVLARTGEPLSGRAVAALTNGRFGQWRVSEVLGDLADAGIVLRESRPPAKLYRLNRDHVAAMAIEALAGQREALLSRIRAEVAEWDPAPAAAWLFGSAARGDGGPNSDIDILLVRADDLDENDPTWLAQVDRLSRHIPAWSGNQCAVLELSADELSDRGEHGERLVDELRADALPLGGAAPRAMLRRRTPVTR